MIPLACSVIIPAFNAEKTVNSCLESLLDQSVSPGTYEVVLVDDGSTDRTRQIAETHDIHYVYQPNQGPASARNRGVEAAGGRIVLFTDSDCTPDRFWIEEMLKPFADPSVSGVKGAYRTLQKKLTPRFAQAEFDDRFRLLRQSKSIDMVDTYSAGYRRDLFLRAGGFDESFPTANNEDTDFSYRLATAGHRLVFNPDAIVFHHHPDSLIRYLKLKYSRGYWRMMVYSRYPKKAVKDSYTPVVIKFQSIVMAIVLALIPFAGFSRVALACEGIMTGFLVISTLPFSRTVFQTDKGLGLISPIYCLLRAVVFALGSLHGIAAALIRK